MTTSLSIEAKNVETRHLAAVKFHAKIADLGEHMGSAFQAVFDHLVAQGVQPSGPAVALYTPTAESEFDVAAGFPVAQAIVGDGNVVPVDLPSGKVAVTTYVGGYDGLPGVYEAVLSWIQQHGHQPGNVMWEEYFSEPTAPPEETRTDVYWLIG